MNNQTASSRVANGLARLEPIGSDSMQLIIGSQFELIDRNGAVLGMVTIQSQEGDYVAGSFNPTPAFETLKPYFDQFVQAANEQLFLEADRLEKIIAGFELHFASRNGIVGPVIRQVGVFDNEIDFRVGPKPHVDRV